MGKGILMRNDNYPSASAVVRNLKEINTPWQVLDTVGKFRVIRFDPPFFDGYEIWIVNEKSFLWESAGTIEDAIAYLASDEAKEYNS